MIRRVAFAAFIAAAAAVPSVAGEIWSAEEAEDLMDRAVEHAERVGRDAAYKDFSRKDGNFVVDALYIYYVFCRSENGDVLAHGGDSGLVGKDLAALTGADGKGFVKEMIQAARAKDGGWIDYEWANPATGRAEEKSSFIHKIGEDICGVGIHRE